MKDFIEDNPLVAPLLLSPIIFIGLLWWFIGDTRDTLGTLKKIENISRDCFMMELNTSGPLTSNKYIDALSFPTLKEKSHELIRIYNRQHHSIRLIRERLTALQEMGKIDEDVVKAVHTSLEELEKDNARIKGNFDKIVAFAEVQYTQSYKLANAPDAAEKERLFAEENRALLESVSLPISLKGEAEATPPAPTKRAITPSKVEERPEINIEISIDPMEENSSARYSSFEDELDGFISHIKSIGGRESNTKLFEKRLLSLLPSIKEKKNVNLTLPETKGNTALHYACGMGYYELVEWLVKNGANVNKRTDKGVTPLQCIGQDPEGRIKNVLIRHGAN